MLSKAKCGKSTLLNILGMLDKPSDGQYFFLDEEVDDLIIGNLGILLMARNMGVDVPFFASTFLASTNYEAAAFFKKIGFSRVILERHLMMNEISTITRHSEVDIEALVTKVDKIEKKQAKQTKKLSKVNALAAKDNLKFDVDFRTSYDNFCRYTRRSNTCCNVYALIPA